MHQNRFILWLRPRRAERAYSASQTL